MARLAPLVVRLLRVVLLVFAALAVTFVAAYVLTLILPEARALIERRFIFFPDKELAGTPAYWGLSFEEVHFSASDGVKLHGWFVPGDKDKNVTWIWFHGNAGNVSHRLENLALLHSHLGVNIFLFDYRGYGRSEGQVSEKGTYQDARGALDYVLSRQDINPQKIVYYGRSLGAAVAVWLATEPKVGVREEGGKGWSTTHQPYGLILETPFTSVKEMAKLAFPYLPLYLLVRSKYDSLSRIGKVSCPLLIIHGDKDEIVPISQARKIYDAASGPKSFYTVHGAGHNDTYIVGQEPYFRALADFTSSLNSTGNQD